MAKKPLVEIILQMINIVFTVWGLGIIGYGLVCYSKSTQGFSKEVHEDNTKYMIVGRLLLAIDHLPKYHTDYDTLPVDWYIYLIIGIGGLLLIVSLVGSVGTATRSPCCLLAYSWFLGAHIIVELAAVVFTYFDQRWEKVIPQDRNDYFHMVYHFVNANWKIIKTIAIGVIVLQVIAIYLAMYLRSVFHSAPCDKRKDERVVYVQRARTHNHRVVAPTTSTTTSTTTKVNANINRDPTKPSTTPSTTTNVNANIDPTKPSRTHSSKTKVNVNVNRDSKKPSTTQSTTTNVNANRDPTKPSTTPSTTTKVNVNATKNITKPFTTSSTTTKANVNVNRDPTKLSTARAGPKPRQGLPPRPPAN